MGYSGPLVRKYLEYSLGVWINAAISFFTVPVVSWLVSPEEFGKVAMYTSILGGLSAVVQMGTSDAFMRFYNEYRNKSYLTTLCLIPQVLAYIPVSILVVVFGRQIEKFIQGREGGAIWVILVVHLLFNILVGLSMTIIRMSGSGLMYSGFSVLGGASGLILTIVLCLLVERSYRAIIASQLISSMLASLLLLLHTKEYWKLSRPKAEDLRVIFNYSWPLLFGSFLWWLTNWTDKFMLRGLSTFGELGIYSAASRVASALNLVTSGFSALWYPYAYDQMSNEEAKEKFVLVANVVAFVMFFLAGVIFATRRVIFKLLFASSYEAAATSVGLLTVPVVMTALMVVMGRGINFAKKTYLTLITNTSAIGTNVALNWMLIPRLGAFGASIGTALSFLVIFSVEVAFSQKLYKVPYELWKVYTAFLLYLSLNISQVFNGMLKNLTYEVAVAILFFAVLLILYRETILALPRRLQ